MLKDKKEKNNLKRKWKKNMSQPGLTHKHHDHGNGEILEPGSFNKFNS